MPLTRNQHDQLEATFGTQFTATETAQAQYRSTHRKFGQVLRGPTRRPAHQPDGLPVDIPVEWEVHEYEKADGRLGWVLYGRAVVDSVEYVRAKQAGPETYRDRDWTEVEVIHGSTV